MTNAIPITHAVTPALLILGLRAPTKSKLLPRRCNASDQSAGLSWGENRAAGTQVAKDINPPQPFWFLAFARAAGPAIGDGLYILDPRRRAHED